MNTDNIPGTDQGRGEMAERFLLAMNNLRKEVGTDVPAHQIQVLTYFWLNGGANQQEVGKALNLNAAAASRNCRSLSGYYKKVGGVPVMRGQGLLVGERSIYDTRAITYKLSQMGEAIMFKFYSDLTGLREAT